MLDSNKDNLKLEAMKRIIGVRIELPLFVELPVIDVKLPNPMDLISE